jgi:hypothetical protein
MFYNGNKIENTIFLTRFEYDRTIVSSPLDIRDAYDRCCTTWNIGGVRITGDAKDVTAIHLLRVKANNDD